MRVVFMLVVGALLLCCNEARAASCSEVTPGARTGPNVPAGTFNPAFTLPYSNSCFVEWPGNDRGQAGRDADERKCHSLEGAQFLEFDPDQGKNFNLCVFRPTGGGSANTGGAGSCVAALVAAFQDGVDASDTPPSTGGPECNQWINRVECRSAIHKATQALQNANLDIATAQARIAGIMCADDAGLLARAQALLAQAQANGGPAQQQSTSDTAKPFYTVRVCNRANDGPLSVAVGLVDDPASGQWAVHAWWIVPSGQCQNVISRKFGSWNSVHFYVHAHTKNYIWPVKSHTDRGFCINPIAKTDEVISGGQCRAPEKYFPFFDSVVNRENELLNKNAPLETVYTENIGQ